MGMYTGLRVKAVVNKKYSDDFDYLINSEYDDNWDETNTSGVLKNFYSSVSRASSIPFGALCYMPWDDEDKKWQRSYNPETREVVFQCSLKNYDNTIEAFLKICPIIFDKLSYCEVLYEEFDESDMYVLDKGKLVQLEEGIKYGNF